MIAIEPLLLTVLLLLLLLYSHYPYKTNAAFISLNQAHIKSFRHKKGNVKKLDFFPSLNELSVICTI